MCALDKIMQGCMYACVRQPRAPHSATKMAKRCLRERELGGASVASVTTPTDPPSS